MILITQVAFVSWVSDSEIARSIYLICYALMMPTVLYLLVVRVLRRWLPLENWELLLGYIVLTATIPIVGFGGLRFLMPGAGYIPYFATSQPQWVRYVPFMAHLPVPHDPTAIRAFFRGGHVPWSAWAGCIGFWSVYLLLMSGIWLCLAAIMHRIWIRQERLSFPITVLPLRLTDAKENIFRTPLFWGGFVIPVILQSLLVLHDWYPSIPAVQLKATDVKPLMFTSLPWSAIPSLSIGFYPMAIGLAYFVPSDVSLSCWVFWILTKLSYVAAATAGIDASGSGGGRFPYPEEQACGAWLALGAMMLWGVRHHWPDLMATTDRGDRRLFAWAGMGAAVCALLCAAMMGFTGIAPLAAIVVIAVYVLYVICGARVRAEAGGMWTFAPLVWTPFHTAASLSRLPAQAGQGLAAGGLFDLLHVDIRAQSLPYLMEGLKIADRAGISWRTVIKWVAIGSVTALAVGWWSGLSNFYAVGAATSKSNAYALVKAQIGFSQMDGLTTTRPGVDQAGLAAVLVGGLITVGLSALRLSLNAFPLHPLGYVLCNTLTMGSMFMPFLLAWMVKAAVQRYGGNRIYHLSVGFFVGLILGDVMTQTFWTIVGRLFDVPIYQFLS
jgi:hypothetical protein